MGARIMQGHSFFLQGDNLRPDVISDVQNSQRMIDCFGICGAMSG